MSGDYFVVRKGATALRNEVVYNPNLSYAAVGVLARALAAPPGAPLGYRAFVGRGLGEKAVRAVMRELEDAGHRWQFRVKKADGSLRTLTVFADVPMTMDEARAEVRSMGAGFVLDCSTQTERLRRSDRAATGAARADQARCSAAGELSEDCGEGGDRAATGAARRDQARQGVSPGGAVQRSSAAHPGAALSRRETKSSSLRSELLTDQTPSVGTQPPAPVGSGQVGSVVEDQGGGGAPAASPSTEPGPGSTVDLSLIGVCLPLPMQVLDAQGARMVARLLGERVESGWKPQEIRALMDQPLPAGGVGRMSALVASRLRDNVDPMMAPGRLRSQASRVVGSLRLVPVAVEDQVRVDPEWAQAWSWVQDTHPEVSRREQVALAVARVDDMRGGAGA